MIVNWLLVHGFYGISMQGYKLDDFDAKWDIQLTAKDGDIASRRREVVVDSNVPNANVPSIMQQTWSLGLEKGCHCHY